MNCLDKLYIDKRASRSTIGRVNLGTLGREALPGFCFLGPRRLGRSSRFTALDIDLDFLF